MTKMILRALGAFILSAIWLGPVLADINVTPGSGAVIFDYACFTSKHCPAVTLTKSDGTEVGVVGAPVRVDPTGTTTQPVSGPLTDTQLRATAVPVSGPLTDTQLRATAVPISGSVNATLGAETTKVIGTVNQGTSPWVVSGSVNATLGAETTKVIGTVNQGTSPWVVSGAVTNAGTFAVQAAQSDTWTVQPGNTANTTPWIWAPSATPTTLTAWNTSTGANATQVVYVQPNGAPAILVSLKSIANITAGAVTFEGTYDGTFTDKSDGSGNPIVIPVAQVQNPASACSNLTNPYTLVTSTASTQSFMIFTQGFQSVRIKLTTQITASSGAGTTTPSVVLLSHLPWDPTLCNPLSAGAAIIGKVGTDTSNPGVSNAVSTIDPCSFLAKTAITINTTASAKLVSLTSAKKTYICSFALITAGAENITLMEGTGTVCASATQTGLIGGITAATGLNLAANGGITLGNGTATIAAGTTNAHDVCLLKSASGQVSGVLTYVQN